MMNKPKASPLIYTATYNKHLMALIADLEELLRKGMLLGDEDDDSEET